MRQIYNVLQQGVVGTCPCGPLSPLTGLVLLQSWHKGYESEAVSNLGGSSLRHISSSVRLPQIYNHNRSFYAILNTHTHACTTGTHLRLLIVTNFINTLSFLSVVHIS